MQGVTIVKHPLVQHKLSLMRDKTRSTSGFRQLVREIAMLLAYEVTHELPMTTQRIETPLQAMDAPMIDGKKLVLAPSCARGSHSPRACWSSSPRRVSRISASTVTTIRSRRSSISSRPA